jgi:periplasmic divalent cation tolerance protein
MSDIEHDLVEVTITAPDPDWLTDLCRQLVDARLASSAHVIHPITSIYRWDGDVHQATEARAFLRSRLELVDALTAYVAERHDLHAREDLAVFVDTERPGVPRLALLELPKLLRLADHQELQTTRVDRQTHVTS